MNTQRCKKCRRQKPLSEYYGANKICKACKKVSRRLGLKKSLTMRVPGSCPWICVCGRAYRSELAMEQCELRKCEPVANYVRANREITNFFTSGKLVDVSALPHTPSKRPVRAATWSKYKNPRLKFCKECKQPVLIRTTMGLLSDYCAACKTQRLIDRGMPVDKNIIKR